MSTLPGQASKGEKTKQKFQSLDINNLYRVSRGENLEKTTQKSSLTYIKHGMQSLGKVPNARRAPANLPSLKAEHSGSDAAVPLVPAGSPGWGKQDQTPSPGPQPSSQSSVPGPAPSPSQQHPSPQQPSQPNQGQQQQQQTQQQQQQQGQQLSAHQQAIALPVTTQIQHKQSSSAGNADKLWSSVMGGHPDHSSGAGGQPPLYHSAQFQHEFPSLDGQPPSGGTAGGQPYPPGTGGGPGGLSLRPQTEGSWSQGGGQRAGVGVGPQQGFVTGGVIGGGGGGVENGPAVPGGQRHLAHPSSVGMGGGVGGPPQLPSGIRSGPGAGGSGMMPGSQHQPPVVEQPFPPQIRGVLPPFMCKGSNFQQGPVSQAGMGTNQQHMQQQPHQQQRINGRQQQPPPRMSGGSVVNSERGDDDSIVPRPIIREEDLNRMDEIGRDMGWAESGEIDYNQKLAFSDDESEMASKSSKKDPSTRRQTATPKDQSQQGPTTHQQQHHDMTQTSFVNADRGAGQWQRSRGGRSGSTSQQVEEEDLRAQQRRTQTDREVELAVQRAKQRKEEEEKRFQEERKQGAAKKLMELEEKIQKRANDHHDKPVSNSGSLMNHLDIPLLPDFQKDKERDNRSKTPNDTGTGEDKNSQGSSFRHMTQIESKGGFGRKTQHQKGSGGTGMSDRDQNSAYGPRHFQYDLPPRFKNQRNNSSSNVQSNNPPPPTYISGSYQWTSNSQQPHNVSKQHAAQSPPTNRNSRMDSPDIENKDMHSDERREYKRQSSEDSYRSSHSHHSQQDLQKISESNRYPDEGHQGTKQHLFESQYASTRKDEDKWHKDKEKDTMKEDWGSDRRSGGEKREDKYERERPHRPDSRDSRGTRHSRDSDPYPWSETAYEPMYEEKKKDDRRMAVPGPITKERIEAEDQRGGGVEKRGLTQLKKGTTADKHEIDSEGSWADIIPDELEQDIKMPHDQHHKVQDQKTQQQHQQQSEQMQKKDDYLSSGRHRAYSQKKNWAGSGSEYHLPRSQPWSKRTGSRHKGGKDYHPGTTDSDASAEEHISADLKSDTTKHDVQRSQRSPKPTKKQLDKDDKNKENKQAAEQKQHQLQPRQEKSEKKDNYIPRGEPSRHGRGGGAFRSGGGSGRMGGLGKRIDGYGPPPSKSPFSHSSYDDKERRTSKDESNTSSSTTHQQASTTTSSVGDHANSHQTTNTASTSTTVSSEDKIKQQQQALAAGIIGKKAAAEFAKDDVDSKGSQQQQHSTAQAHQTQVQRTGSSSTSGGTNRDRGGGRQDNKRLGSKSGKGKESDSLSETIDEKSKDKVMGKPQGPRSSQSRGRNNQPPRMSGNERRSYDRNRQNSSASLKRDEKSTDQQNALAGAIADVSLKDHIDGEEREETGKTGTGGDTDGFQEVKSKKNVSKDQRQKPVTDEKAGKNGQNKEIRDRDRDQPQRDINKERERDRDRDRKNKNTSQLTQQMIQNIPPLMATPVNPPAGMNPPQSQQQSSGSSCTQSSSDPPPPPSSSLGGNKGQFDGGRPRQPKLAPRFAKQKLQKVQQQMQQQQNINLSMAADVRNIGKGINMYGMKDVSASQSNISASAWDKPLGSQLRNLDHDNSSMIGVSMDSVKTLDASLPSPQGTSPNSEKMHDKPLLDGTTPPVNTIIFENTNFKQAPGVRSSRSGSDKPRTGISSGGVKLDEIGGSTGSGTGMDSGASSASSMIGGFGKTAPCTNASGGGPGMNELLENKDTNKQESSSSGSIQLPLFKEDSADMKLDFFGSELQFSSSDDKSKNLCMSKSIHAIASGNNTVDSLDIKIASVKKVWETSEQEGEDISFVGPPLDSNVFTQGKETPDDSHHHHHDAYATSPNQTAGTTTNVCKVKPTQQVSGGTSSGTNITSGVQSVTNTSSGHHQQHGGGGGMVAPGLMGNPLSPPPPPMPQMLAAAAAAAAAAHGVGLGPTGQYTTNQHIGYQTSLSGSTQYGMSAIPSPPTVPLAVYGQTAQQQLQQAAAAGLYGAAAAAAFQMDQIGGARPPPGPPPTGPPPPPSQYSQYAPSPAAVAAVAAAAGYHHGSLGQTASSPYTYLQAAPPHGPPPSAATAQAPPELYTNYHHRLSAAAAAFGQTQQLSNPTTMLISSTTNCNSLMSAVTSVKPPGTGSGGNNSQTISAIGTKAGSLSQTSGGGYQTNNQSSASNQQSQQASQQVAYAMYDPSIAAAAAAANYLATAAGAPPPHSAAAMRGGPPPPQPPPHSVQNSVAAAVAQAQGLQPSSSFYSTGSTSQTAGYFQQPTNTSLQSQQLQQHQASYGSLQGNVFGSHGQSHTGGTGLQSYNSHFLTTPMQVAAALNAQQFRSGLPAAAAAAYMKGVAGQQMGGDQSSRAQQLKSPGSQEVLSSVFNSGPQIPSPKSRQNCKQPPPQSSPTSQQKYNLYQGVGNQQNPNIQRYPTPIQRPVNFQQMQQNNTVNQKHRNNPSSKAPNRQYYSGQMNSISVQNDKSEDTKMNESVSLSGSVNTSNTAKTSISSSAANGTDKVKDNIKEETATALKD